MAGLLMRGSRVVIPTSLRAEVLAQLHAGHQGIKKLSTSKAIGVVARHVCRSREDG